MISIVSYKNNIAVRSLQKTQSKNKWLSRSDPFVHRASYLNSKFLQLLLLGDRSQTVLRRSEPNSRTSLFGEQPNPWNRLQLQDEMSRHRGAKPYR